MTQAERLYRWRCACAFASGAMAMRMLALDCDSAQLHKLAREHWAHALAIVGATDPNDWAHHKSAALAVHDGGGDGA